jgi:hypothetical protein
MGHTVNRTRVLRSGDECSTTELYSHFCDEINQVAKVMLMPQPGIKPGSCEFRSQILNH